MTTIMTRKTAATPPRHAARPQRRRGRRAARTVVFHAVSIALAVIILYPGAWMVISAFRPSSNIIGETGLIPDESTLDNFRTALEGIGGISFWTYFTNSMILAVGSVIGVCLSCSLTAYAFARISFPGRNLYFALMIGTLLLPYHVLLIPQYVLFRNLEMINTYTPLLLGKYLATEAFFVFLMVQFMRNLPRELDEAARLDGCGHLRIYWSIVLPLCRPALITSAIFTFINAWNDFMGPLIYLNEPGKYTVSLGLKMFVDQEGLANYGGMIAMSLVALLPVLAFFLAFQRYLIDGMATSGLKG